MEYLDTLIYLAPLIFLAGFIDSAVGGGGTISIPAYMLTGMPIHMAVGTNKLSACLGTAVAAGRFIKNKAIDIKTAIISAAGSLVGAALGAQIVLMLHEDTLRLMMIIALPCVAVFLVFRKNKAHEPSQEGLSPKRMAALAVIIGFGIGLYDGIIGPGTGTFAIIAYNVFMRFDLVTASGNAKILNLASNFASVVTFIIAGNVYIALGLIAAVFGIAGNYFGAGFAIKKGAKVLRPLLFVVLALLLVTIIFDPIGRLA